MSPRGPRGVAGAPRRTGARLLLLLVATLFSLGAAELALRLAGYEYRPMQVAAGPDPDARFYHLFSDAHFVYDPELIWRPRPGHAPFNAMGYRGPEVGPLRLPGTVRIFALGDSNTLGWADEEGANWPAELGRLLRAQGGGYEVVNAGVWGYSSFQGLARLREVLELSPDLVLISFGSNDAHRVARPDSDFARRPLLLRRLELTLREWRLMQLLAAVREGVRPAQAALRPRVDLEEYEHNLRSMVEACRRRDAVPVLLPRPFVGPVTDELWWKNFGADYNRAAARVAEAEGVLLIDLYSFFKPREDLFADESHFTAPGHRAAAEIVRLHLQALLPPDGRKAAR